MELLVLVAPGFSLDWMEWKDVLMQAAHRRGSNLPHPQLLNQALQNLLLPVSTLLAT